MEWQRNQLSRLCFIETDPQRDARRRFHELAVQSELFEVQTNHSRNGRVSAIRGRGERVSIRKGSPRENDSTPYYVRGKPGIVEEICAPFTNPHRTASKPTGGAPLRTYRTRFWARDVWPELPGASGETFIIQLSEDWLMPLHWSAPACMKGAI